MICRIAELQYKEVIDIADGTRYGYVGDLEFDPERGSIQSIVVAGRPRCFGLLGHEADVVFPWSAVRRFGEDIILVEGGRQAGQARRREK